MTQRVEMLCDIETTGLDPFADSIITVQLKRDGKIYLWKAWECSEAELLRRFLHYLSTIPPHEPIAGYNNLRFDVPFLIERTRMLHGLDRATWTIIYHHNWLDLYQFLGDNLRSLQSWLDRLGLQRTTRIRGRDVPALYGAGRYAQIEEYVLDELALCERLWTQLLRRYPTLLGERPLPRW